MSGDLPETKPSDGRLAGVVPCSPSINFRNAYLFATPPRAPTPKNAEEKGGFVS